MMGLWSNLKGNSEPQHLAGAALNRCARGIGQTRQWSSGPAMKTDKPSQHLARQRF